MGFTTHSGEICLQQDTAFVFKQLLQDGSKISKSEPARLILTIIQEPYTVIIHPGTMIRNNTKTYQISGCFRSSLVFCSSVFFLKLST